MRFRPNPLFEAQIKANPRYKAGLATPAQLAAEEIGRLSPTRKVAPRARGNVVVTDSPIWHIIEYGSKNNPAYAPFRRGVRAVGLKLREEPKQ